MTRRLFCGLLCIVLALLAGVSGEVYLRTAAHRLLDSLQPPPNAGETGIFEAAARAVQTWDTHEKLLGAMIKHSDADALGVLFERLRTGVENRDLAVTKTCLEACAAQTRVLLAGERLCWENILRTALKND